MVSEMLWSVVVPTYNRLPILQKCLAALEKQTITAPYEILVIDDGSSDGTVEFLSANSDRYPHLRLLTQDHAAAAAARNYGIDSALGKYIAFVDSDITVNPDYLQAHTETLAKGEKFYSYGRIIDTSNLESPDSEPVSPVPYLPPRSLILVTWRSPANGYSKQENLIGVSSNMVGKILNWECESKNWV